ncbi:MAG: trypsin-like peptidase domain-containing protein [Acidimicrobiales bacterium]|nr:trypsin-like peptidase domain-containing protein [Acidimicrobiales bacterium]MYG61765.1 trypsin-like peptidase domain-containing protein [Acidimicrobiales bacterium]MYJ47903.1 trypsin-like peptidase domain-containing protein [Acidimicrobiales bacterium]
MTRPCVTLAAASRRRHERPVRRLVLWAARSFGAVLLVGAMVACAADPDDSGRGRSPVATVASIPSADGPVWLGAPPAAVTVDDGVLVSVVSVHAFGCGPVSHGSGFAVASGLLVGSAHVVAGASSVEIAWNAGGDELVTASADIVGFDPERDLVLLRSDAAVPPLRIERVRYGSTAAVIGYLQGERLEVTPARIEHLVRASGLWGDGIGRNVYFLAADVQKGQSGGPLVDRGGVVGVAFATATGPDDIGYALSRGELLGFLTSSGVDVGIDYRGDAVIHAQPASLGVTSSGDCRLR